MTAPGVPSGYRHTRTCPIHAPHPLSPLSSSEITTFLSSAFLPFSSSILSLSLPLLPRLNLTRSPLAPSCPFRTGLQTSVIYPSLHPCINGSAAPTPVQSDRLLDFSRPPRTGDLRPPFSPSMYLAQLLDQSASSGQGIAGNRRLGMSL